MESRIYGIPYIQTLSYMNHAYMNKQFLNLKKKIEWLPSNPAGRTLVFYKLKISHIQTPVSPYIRNFPVFK